MKDYSLRLWSDIILKEKSLPVEDFFKLEKLIPLFYETMLKHSAIGLKAHQLGIDEHFFVAKVDGVLNVFVNLEIKNSSGYIQ